MSSVYLKEQKKKKEMEMNMANAYTNLNEVLIQDEHEYESQVDNSDTLMKSKSVSKI